MNSLRVVHVGGNRYRPLSYDHATKNIWRTLSSGFDEYHVIARSLDGQASESREGRVFLHLLPSAMNSMLEFFFTSWLVVWYVFKLRPNRLVVQCPVLGGMAAAFCSAIFKIPLLVELHGAHYFHPKVKGFRGFIEYFFYRTLSPFAFRQASKIRSLSPHMTETLVDVYGSGLKEKVVEIPTRVDLKVFSSVKDSYAIRGLVKIVSVGSYISVKNLSALLEDLSKSGIDFNLTLVGDGPLATQYQSLAEELGVSQRLTLTGRLSQSELSALLVEQDIYVHYSLTEGLARAILEAMALGLPVVATDVGFIKGVLDDHNNCIVLREPWSKSLSIALTELSGSESLRARLGREARRLICDRYEASAVFASYRKTIVAL